MKYTIDCKDVGVDCDWSAEAESEDALMDKVVEHAREGHPGLELTPQMAAQVKGVIRRT